MTKIPTIKSLFNRLIARIVSGINPKTNQKSIWDLGTKFVTKGDPRNGSVDHDKYLYN